QGVQRVPGQRRRPRHARDATAIERVEQAIARAILQAREDIAAGGRYTNLGLRRRPRLSGRVDPARQPVWNESWREVARWHARRWPARAESARHRRRWNADWQSPFRENASIGSGWDRGGSAQLARLLVRQIHTHGPRYGRQRELRVEMGDVDVPDAVTGRHGR